MFKILHFLKMLFLLTTYYPFIALFDFVVEKKKEYKSKCLTIQLNYSNCKLYRITENKVSHSKNIIYFSNHRSWADFFIDNIVTEYCTKFISRIEVAYILPLYVYINGDLLLDVMIFFRRGKTSISEFENLIKHNQLNNKSGNDILVYPEGTRRSGLDYACDLKKGLIYYAYKENCPIQFIISKNKENFLNEKRLTAEKNVNVFVHYSHVYYPDFTKYRSMQEFYDFINAEWKTTFNAIYSRDHESKIHEYQQIDTTKIHDDNYYINKTLLYGIRIGIISTVVLIPAILLKLI
jgi:1-acyl-sn-glycerol-3-phosphate acyltransferase